MTATVGGASKIFILEPNVGWRSTYLAAARDAEFSSVETCGTFTDLLEKVAATAGGDTPTVLTSLDESNDAHFVRAIGPKSNERLFRNCRHLVLHSQRQEHFLPYFYENGVLATLMTPCSQDVVRAWLSTFKKDILTLGKPEELMAVNFLGESLQKSGNIRDLERLLRQLLVRFPGALDVSLKLAELECVAGKSGEARELLLQTSAMNPTERKTIAQKALRLGLDAIDFNDTMDESFGVSSLFVIDNDVDLLATVERVFEQRKINVKTFIDPAVALAALDAGATPQAILFDWRLPQKGGSRFVQRIVAMGATHPLLIALSGFLRPTDGRLLQELGVVEIIPKPFSPYELVDTILKVIQRERLGSEPGAAARRLKADIRNMEGSDARAVVNASFESGAIGRSIAELLQAEIDLRAGDAPECARRLGRLMAQVSSDAGQRVQALHLLGCSLLKLGRVDQALQVFSKTEELSPENLERMCLIAQCHAEKKDWAACSDSMRRAIEVDPENPIVVQTAARIAKESGDRADADDFLSAFGTSTPYIAQMNNVAVALSRSGDVAKASEMFQKLIALCGPKHELATLLFFNSLVVLCRQGNTKEAKVRLSARFGDSSSGIASLPTAQRRSWAKLRAHLGLRGGDDASLEEPAPANPGSAPSVTLATRELDDLLKVTKSSPWDTQRGLRGLFFSSQEFPLEIQMMLTPKARVQRS